MIFARSKNIEIVRVFKTVKRLNELIKAFNLLFDVKPIIEVSGYFATHDGKHEHHTEYDEISRVTNGSIYFKYNGFGKLAFIPQGEHCFVKFSHYEKHE